MLHSFSRTEILIGTQALEKLKTSKVAVFGIGGVGTFVVEALARSAVGELVLVDDDDICLTNINRQIHAMRSTVGQSKVDAMKERVLDINPDAKVTAYKKLYNADSAEELLSDDYDYVVDAIDMVSAKLDLIERCKKRGIPVISAMGAGNKFDPTKLKVSDINDTLMCPLARVMRKELKRRNVKGVKVVYSTEKSVSPIDIDGGCKTNCICTNKDDVDSRSCSTRRQTPGTMSFVPSALGLIIASEVVKDLLEGYLPNREK